MVPIFTTPLALFALLGLPALAVIYLLRSRPRRLVVSSVMLWLDPRQPRAGGRKLDWLQTLLLFLVELVLLALLALAAAGPFLTAPRAGRPLVVILDDSFSMLAGGSESPRAAALAALDDELQRRRRLSVRFVLAGERPTLLGRNQLDQWRCQSPSADLDAALTLAAEIDGEVAALLVLTDRAPPRPLGKGRVLWQAFGHRRPNSAIVSAARSTRDGVERCVIAVESLYDAERATTLVVEALEPLRTLERRELTLRPGIPEAVVIALPAGTGTLRASVSADDLDFDNRVTLAPAPERLVGVELALGDPVLLQQTRRALKAAMLVDDKKTTADVLITDAATPRERPGEQWLFHLKRGKENVAVAGPLVLERTHPLTEGLSLKGVTWSPAADGDVTGDPLILAGDTVLAAATEETPGRHAVTLRLPADPASLFASSAWPVFVSNLLAWRADQLPGLTRGNVRLGERVKLVCGGDERDLIWRRPAGSSETLTLRNQQVVAHAEQPGVHEIIDGDAKYFFAANALNREESDLRGCVSGTFGDWLDETGLRLDHVAVGGALVLAALALSVLHLLLTRRFGDKHA